MGSYLNPGSMLFRGSLRSKIYVDKSGLIEKSMNWSAQNRNMSVSAVHEDLANLWLRICWLPIIKR